MKNLKTLLTMAIVALMSLSFTSCDEDADIGDTLYGTWKGYMDIGLTYGDLTFPDFCRHFFTL